MSSYKSCKHLFPVLFDHYMSLCLNLLITCHFLIFEVISCPDHCTNNKRKKVGFPVLLHRLKNLINMFGFVSIKFLHGAAMMEHKVLNPSMNSRRSKHDSSFMTLQTRADNRSFVLLLPTICYSVINIDQCHK